MRSTKIFKIHKAYIAVAPDQGTAKQMVRAMSPNELFLVNETVRELPKPAGLGLRAS